MATPRPNVIGLAELAPGQRADFFAVLLDRTSGTTREGKPYYHCRFGDARRAVSLMVWGDDRWYAPAQQWRPGAFYKLRAVYSEHERYGPQIELANIRPVKESDAAEGFDPAALVEMPPREPSLLLGELRAVVEATVTREAHRGLVLDLLEEHAEALMRLPATRDRGYPYRGGLVEHTLAVVAVALDLAARYAERYPDLSPPLDRELLCAAAALHDLGRVRELGEEVPVPAPTVAGRLAGAGVLGRDLVRDAARDRPGVEAGWLELLEHLVLTCATGEAAPGKGPMLAEGVLLQQADELDLKMSLVARCLRRDSGAGPFTERDPGLGRRLLKRRGV